VSNFFKDVIATDARYSSPARIADVDLLEPLTRQLVSKILSAAQNLGIQVAIFETYRSQARQQALYAQGLTQLAHVGVHHYGLACDIVKVINGEPSWKGDFGFLGQLAHSAGLIWGGDWGNPDIGHDFIDSVHVQRCTVARQPELFAGNWYPSDGYNPYSDEPHVLFASVTGGARPAIESQALSVQPTSAGPTSSRL
jgi:hypothetical protein